MPFCVLSIVAGFHEPLNPSIERVGNTTASPLQMVIGVKVEAANGLTVIIPFKVTVLQLTEDVTI